MAAGVAYYPARFFHVLEELQPSRTDIFLDVSAADVAVVQNLRQKLAQQDHTVFELRRFISQLRSLKALPHSSPLRFLGYFGVLEALLTHQPKPNDPYDSITRQVKQKLALLNNRWQPAIDYSPFANAPADNIWGAMYACRSRIAHGADIDFAERGLRVLKNREEALALLVDTVKAIMRHALDEPQLLHDLRNC